jgi:hypothetical protein
VWPRLAPAGPGAGPETGFWWAMVRGWGPALCRLPKSPRRAGGPRPARPCRAARAGGSGSGAGSELEPEPASQKSRAARSRGERGWMRGVRARQGHLVRPDLVLVRTPVPAQEPDLVLVRTRTPVLAQEPGAPDARGPSTSFKGGGGPRRATRGQTQGTWSGSGLDKGCRGPPIMGLWRAMGLLSLSLSPNRILFPSSCTYRFRSDSRGCSRANALQCSSFRVLRRRSPASAFLSKASTAFPCPALGLPVRRTRAVSGCPRRFRARTGGLGPRRAGLRSDVRVLAVTPPATCQGPDSDPRNRSETRPAKSSPSPVRRQQCSIASGLRGTHLAGELEI